MSQSNKAPTKGELTARKIRQAKLRIEKGRPKVVDLDREMSISAVAEEAGVHHSTIHNNYPDIAEQIRRITNKTSRAQRDEKNAELKKLRAKLAALRKEHIRVRELNQDIVSELASMAVELERLRSIVGNEKVVGFPSKKDNSVI